MTATTQADRDLFEKAADELGIPTTSQAGFMLWQAARSQPSSLPAGWEELRTANRKLHRRLQQAEAPLKSMENHVRHLSDRWIFEFTRLTTSYAEIKAIFLELTRIYDYPMNGRHMHSTMDDHRKPGIWANCFESVHGGTKSYRVLDEVRRAVNELEALRAAAPEKDAKDAARYRHVRAKPEMLLHLSNKDFDDAIDKSISQGEGE